MRTLLVRIVVTFALALMVGFPDIYRAEACVGDCDSNGQVEVAELVRGVGVSLGTMSITECVELDLDGDGRVSIAELIMAVGHALTGCPTVTPTMEPSALASPTVPPESPTATPTGAGSLPTPSPTGPALLQVVQVLTRGEDFPDPPDGIGIAVSPDGRDVYVASPEHPGAAFRRNAEDGTLNFKAPFGGRGEGIAISPDGRSVYQADINTMRVFARVVDTGVLTTAEEISSEVTGKDILVSSALKKS